MKRTCTVFILTFLVLSGIKAQNLDPTITWAQLEKISLGGQELVVSSGNDGRNLIQYWNREATLVIDNRLFFKAAPPVDPEVDRIDTTYTNVAGSVLGILASALENYSNHCGDTTILNSRPHPGGNTDSLEIYCQVMHIDTVWVYNYIHELWYTEGINETTRQVPGTNNLEEPKHLIEANGHLFFTAIDRSDQIRYIYRFDGAATRKISEFPNPYGLSQFGDEILFGVESAAGFLTCITDVNAAAGSRIISMNIGPCPNSAISATTMQWSQYAPFQVIHTRDDSGLLAIFFGQDKTKGVEICVTDGQTASVILDINDTPDPESDNPEATLSTERGDIIIAVNKYQVAFRVVTPGKWGRDAEAVTLQQNMWITDGTAAGTWLFEDQNRSSATVGGEPATGNSFAGDPFLFQGRLYYTGTTQHDRQIVVMKHTYPNHISEGNSREEWILNGPNNEGAYGNSRTGYFGTYGDYMAFSVRVTHFTDNPAEGVLNRPLEHALVVGNKYDELWVADDGADQAIPGNGNNAMIQHITQYKDKLYYNRFDQNGNRNLRVYIKADLAEGWERDTTFFLGSFTETGGNNASGSAHNLRVMNGSLYFIYKNELYKLTDTQSNVDTPVYDYRDPEHYIPEGIRDWTSCIFDFGYGGEDSMADNCPCEYIAVGVDEVVVLPGLSVYPNPASDLLHVQIDGHQPVRAVIYNIKGVKVFEENLKSQVIDISDLATGVYIIGFITSDNKFLHTKFIKR